jgi:hypothetical protein
VGFIKGEATLCNTVTWVLLIESAGNDALFLSSTTSICLLYHLSRTTGDIAHLLEMHSLDTHHIWRVSEERETWMHTKKAR